MSSRRMRRRVLALGRGKLEWLHCGAFPDLFHAHIAICRTCMFDIGSGQAARLCLQDSGLLHQAGLRTTGART